MKNNSNNKKPHFNYLKIKHSILGKSDLLFFKKSKNNCAKSDSGYIQCTHYTPPPRQPVMRFITTTLSNVDLWHFRENQHCWPWCTGPEAPPAPRFSPFRQLGGDSLKQPIHFVGRNGTPDLTLVIPVPRSSWNLNADFIAAAVLGQKKV